MSNTQQSVDKHNILTLLELARSNSRHVLDQSYRASLDDSNLKILVGQVLENQQTIMTALTFLIQKPTLLVDR